MTNSHQIAILLPLVVGASAVACTIFIRAFAAIATVHFLRRERKFGRVDVSRWIDLLIVALAISVALIPHLVEIGCWAVLFVICGPRGLGVGT